jgi:hypothetical protein
MSNARTAHYRGSSFRFFLLLLRSAWPRFRPLRSDMRQEFRSPVVGAVAYEEQSSHEAQASTSWVVVKWVFGSSAQPAVRTHRASEAKGFRLVSTQKRRSNLYSNIVEYMGGRLCVRLPLMGVFFRNVSDVMLSARLLHRTHHCGER